MIANVAVPPDPPDDIPAKLPDEALPDLSGLQRDWESALATMIADWPDRASPLNSAVVDQVLRAAMSGDLVGLSGLVLDADDLAAWIEQSCLQLAALAADHAVEEAADQDVEINAGRTDRFLLASMASVTAGTLAAGLIMSGVRQAMRTWNNRHGRAQDVADSVAEHLDSLTTAQPEYMLGGALTGAQREGRMATARSGPSQALYSSEILDTNTCKYCRAVHRRWLGNSDDPAEPWLLTYPVRGYVDCLGRDRCRGQVVYVWRGGRDWKKWIEKEAWRP